MSKKTALITGANSGVGTATAIGLAKENFHVIMLCRNKERGNKALEYVIDKSKSKNIELEICDLSILKEINTFCDNFISKKFNLDVLINNAGVILPKRKITIDNIEHQFAVNYVAPFLLSKRLIPTMKKNPHARIINVSSGAHKIGKLDFDNINLDNNYGTFKAYSQSKLALTLFTYELAERLKDTNITVNAVHPGAVATNMGVDRDTGFGSLIMKILKPFFRTPEKGAETSLYLAISQDVKDISGKYFYDKKIQKTSKKSYDRELSKKLWQYTEKLINE